MFYGVKERMQSRSFKTGLISYNCNDLNPHTFCANRIAWEWWHHFNPMWSNSGILITLFDWITGISSNTWRIHKGVITFSFTRYILIFQIFSPWVMPYLISEPRQGRRVRKGNISLYIWKYKNTCSGWSFILQWFRNYIFSFDPSTLDWSSLNILLKLP